MKPSKNKFLIVIAGPTAVGKTSVALKLAKHFDCDILSADSRQLYQELDIGTAKVSTSEMLGIPHHMVNHVSITEQYTTADYERDVIQKLDNIYKNQNVAILCGGTGLYIRAVLDGLDNLPKVPDSFMQNLEDETVDWPISKLQEELAITDPEYYHKAEKENKRRLLRAIGHIRFTGEKISPYLTKSKKQRAFSPINIRLNMDRATLYERINDRVDQMIAHGLLDEVKGLSAYRECRALQTVGYTEIFKHLDNEYDLHHAIELIKRNSRRYAKRQLTWFRNQGNWQEFAPQQLEEIVHYIDAKMKTNEPG